MFALRIGQEAIKRSKLVKKRSQKVEQTRVLREIGHTVSVFLKKNHGMTGFPQKIYGIAGFLGCTHPSDKF